MEPPRFPKPGIIERLREIAGLAFVMLLVVLKDLRASLRSRKSKVPGDFYKSVSTAGDYVHYIIEPLYLGKVNKLVACDPGRLVGYQEEDGIINFRLNASSSSYAGWLVLDENAKSLQQRVLTSTLPQSDYRTSQPLMDLVAAEIADIHGDTYTTMVSMGYTAVLVAIQAMSTPRCVWLMDASSHNSMVVGARAARPAMIMKFKHNDFADLETQIKSISVSHDRLIVAIEGLYGMDGSYPDLHELARLKREYGFWVFCDEAHSCFTLGSGGGSIVQHCRERKGDLPDLIEVRIGNLSKSAGTIGGFIGCNSQDLHARIQAQVALIKTEGSEPMPISAIIQTLYSLRCRRIWPPTLRRLHHMATYVRSQLKEAGFVVHALPGSPVMTIAIGSYIKTVDFCALCGKRGLATLPTAPPAFPVPGVRLSVTAALKDTDVTNLVRIMIYAGSKLGIVPYRRLQLQEFEYQELHSQKETIERLSIRRSAYQSTLDDLERSEDSWNATSTAPHSAHSNAATKAGSRALDTYGLAVCSSRWLNGTTKAHVSLEEHLQELFGGLHVVLLNDTRNAILGSAHALARPLKGCPKHLILHYANGPSAVLDGLVAATRNRPIFSLLTYNSIDDIKAILDEAVKYQQRLAVTIIFSGQLNPTRTEKAASVESFIRSLRTYIDRYGFSITVLIDDSEGMTFNGPKSLGIASRIDIRELMRQSKVRIVVLGSFCKSLQLPGAFMAGDRTLMAELRWTCPTYFFSSSVPPLLVQMIESTLKEKGCTR